MRYFLIALLTVFLIFPSCSRAKSGKNAEVEKDTTKVTTNITTAPATEKTDTIAVDTIAVNTVSADSLHSVVRNLEETVEKLNQDLSNKMGSNHFLVVIVGGLSLFSILVSIFAIILIINVRRETKRRINQRKMEIGKLNEELQKLITVTAVRDNSHTNSEIADLKAKVVKLNKEISAIKQSPTPPSVPAEKKVQTHTENTKQGYFGEICKNNDGDIYFSQLLQSLSGNAKFKATITGNYASFEPINLAVITDYDNPQQAIEITSGSPKGAREMRVKSSGKALCRADKWIIEERVKVELI